MSFDGTEGGQITSTVAAAMTKRYRKACPGQIISHFYGRDTIQALLDQDECMGIRIYYGIMEDGSKELVLVGATADENDMLNLIMDLSVHCPNSCPAPNFLNS